MGRAPCCDKNGLKKGPWTPEEDHKLITYIQTNGPGNWRSLPKNAGLERCGKSCRLRWTNYLRPDIKRGRFSFEEEETIIQLHSILGNKWSAIAARLPGRTDNEIKNYWNTHIRKRLLRNGIDPVTHAPRLDLMDLSSILASALCNSSSSSSSSLLNLSTLQAHALLNPDLLILATTLSSLKHQNQSPPLFSDQQFLENQFPIPPQNSIHHPQFPLVPPQTQQGFPQDTVNSQQGNFTTVIGGGNSENYYSSSGLIQSVMMSDNNNTKQNMGMDDNLVVSPSSLTPQTSSGAPLNSSSTFVNSSSTTDQDERDSYCSSFFKFEIPESLVDFEDFL